MKYSCVYFRKNSSIYYIIFVRKYNIIFINLCNESHIVITIDMLKEDYFLYGYYLLSICLTQNIEIPFNIEKKTWGNNIISHWCNVSNINYYKFIEIVDYFPNIINISSKITELNYTVSSCDKIEKFFTSFYDNSIYSKNSPYYIIERFISQEIEDIHVNLLNIEEEINKIDFRLKTISLLTSKKFIYSLPHDIIHLCFTPLHI